MLEGYWGDAERCLRDSRRMLDASRMPEALKASVSRKMILSRICIEVFGFGFFGFRRWKKYQNVCLIFAAEIVAMDCFWGLVS